MGARLVLAVVLGLSCGYAFGQGGVSLEDLKRMSGSQSSDEDIAQRQARDVVIREAGLAAGSQGGFYARATALQMALERYGEILDEIFRFDMLLEENGRLLPPSVEQTDAERSLESGSRLVETGRVWRVTHPAQLVLAAPTWRNYLMSVYIRPPDRVPANLLPRSNAERLVWEEAVTEGWRLGELQAEQVFAQQYSELATRYIGILRYRALRAMGAIADPTVARSAEAIIVAPDSVRIDHQVIEIMKKAEFQAASTWRAIVTQP
jgi:defect-in-organelle-trafficking protein DotC